MWLDLLALTDVEGPFLSVLHAPLGRNADWDRAFWAADEWFWERWAVDGEGR